MSGSIKDPPEEEEAASSPRRHARWRTLVRVRAQQLRCKVELLTESKFDEERSDRSERVQKIQTMLDRCDKESDDPVGLRDWISGGSVERAWAQHLHPAEEELVGLALDPGREGTSLIVGACSVLDVLAHAERSGLSKNDERVRRLRQYRSDALKAMNTDHDRDDALVRNRYPDVGMLAESVLQEAHQRSGDSHRSVRAFRNLLVLVGLSLVIATAGLIAIQAIWDDFPLLGLPEEAATAGLQPWVWLMLVAVFGGLGGLWAAVNLWLTVPRDPSPYNLPIQQGLLKITAGAFVAVIGLMLISGGVIQGIALETASAVLAVAIVVGYGQQILTTLLDRRASEIMHSEAPEADEPGT